MGDKCQTVNKANRASYSCFQNKDSTDKIALLQQNLEKLKEENDGLHKLIADNMYDFERRLKIAEDE